MPGARSARTRFYLLFVFVVTAVVVSAYPSVACAATLWSNHQPAPLSVVEDTTPAISVVLDDDFTLYPMATVRVDGRLARAKFTWITWSDTTKALITATSPLLADGPHTIFVDVPRQGGLGHVTTTWTFAVGVAPQVSDPSPAPGSRISDDTPLVQAAVSDSGPIASVTVSVDGVDVPATFAGGVVSAQVADALTNDMTHTAEVVAVDGAGLTTNLAWDFYVQTLPSMAVDVVCADCHVGYPDAHPVDNCLSCHGQGGPYHTDYNDPNESHEPGGECYPCHGDISDCESCHGQPYVTVPDLHDFVDDAYHDSSIAECSPCHMRRLTVEHNRFGLDCMTCHASADPAVVQAIAEGDADCYACHTGGHEGLHASPLEALCLDCHQPELVGEHGDRGLTCGVCHASTDPDVLGAIAANDTSCAACHDGSGHMEQHVSSLDDPCQACHQANLVDEHIADLGLSCDTCHASGDPTVIAAIDANDTACFACHSFNDHPYVSEPHASTIATQTLSGTYPSGTSYAVGCTVCHAADLSAEHSRTTSSSSPSACGACHPTPRDTLDPWTGSCVQADCHAVGGSTQQHAAMDLSHLVPAEYASCTGCHTEGDAGAIHADSASSCGACHSTASVPSHLDCGVCHPAQLDPHGYDAAQHTAAVSALTISGTIVNGSGVPYTYYDGTVAAYSGQQCGWCHTMDLYAEHTKATSSSEAAGCAACHAVPRNTFTTWNDTCQQGGCHATYHTDMASKHHWSFTSNAEGCGQYGGSCHPGEWADDLAAVHAEAAYWGSAFDFDFGPYPNGCRVCHTATQAPAVPSGCDMCHVTRHTIAVLP